MRFIIIFLLLLIQISNVIWAKEEELKKWDSSISSPEYGSDLMPNIYTKGDKGDPVSYLFDGDPPPDLAVDPTTFQYTIWEGKTKSKIIIEYPKEVTMHGYYMKLKIDRSSPNLLGIAKAPTGWELKGANEMVNGELVDPVVIDERAQNGTEDDKIKDFGSYWFSEDHKGIGVFKLGKSQTFKYFEFNFKDRKEYSNATIMVVNIKIGELGFFLENDKATNYPVLEEQSIVDNYALQETGTTSYSPLTSEAYKEALNKLPPHFAETLAMRIYAERSQVNRRLYYYYGSQRYEIENSDDDEETKKAKLEKVKKAEADYVYANLGFLTTRFSYKFYISNNYTVNKKEDYYFFDEDKAYLPISLKRIEQYEEDLKEEGEFAALDYLVSDCVGLIRSADESEKSNKKYAFIDKNRIINTYNPPEEHPEILKPGQYPNS